MPAHSQPTLPFSKDFTCPRTHSQPHHSQ